MADTQPYNQPESQADARWMTFAELAAIRGISKLSAVALVRRHGWRRQRDNQGHMTALVPAAWADTEPTNQPEDQPYIATFETALAAIEAAHARELATLQEQITGAEQARIAMQTLVEQFARQLHDADEVLKAERARSDALLADLHRDLDAARGHADRTEAALTGERARADALRDRLEQVQADLTGAQHDAQAALQAAARADARITRAERREEAERSRADAINALLEATQEELAGQRALTDAARQDARAVQEAAEALRQAYAERKGRGRLRRVWDGWRGR